MWDKQVKTQPQLIPGATIITNLELEGVTAGAAAKVMVPDSAVVDVLLSKRSGGCKALFVC